ncbi:M3 family oligoendopeptidase [Gimesia chilikensis]|uniref:M3 family oligoendopeptidase n=1 Tax=Gimesia chilikensis TaxID=2605989 RepID=UPI0011EF8CB3|nr:M3 family oligoendopeptidase [Gimesia chilikensis]KAA0140092.1 M3 family oligoendopeptidase [Gimesia chilikensis]
MTDTASYPLTWELDSLYPNPAQPEFTAILQDCKSTLEALVERVAQLADAGNPEQDAALWADFLTDYQAATAELSGLFAFLECCCAEDAHNKQYQVLMGRLASIRPLRENIETQLQLTLRELSAETIQQFCEQEPRLQEIRFFLEESKRGATLRLPKEQEILASELAVDGLHAWGRLYDRLSGDLKIQLMEKGELVERSPGQVQFDSPQRSIRENNFYAANKAWDTIADSCADALNHLSGTRLTLYKRLPVTDHLDAPLIYNRMQRSTLDTMWSVISERKQKLVRFLEKKAELLGLPRLCWYDLNAPLPLAGAESAELTYDRACELTVNSFAEFSSDLRDFAERSLRERWIEAENRAGKRQGGFCTTLPLKKQSRIFMTFTNSADSMSTLAHELGHAYHSYVLKDAPFVLSDYPMNLAETASTFAEAVLGEQRLKAAKTRDEELQILDGMLGDSVAFMMNIHTRFLFEDRFHQERAAGELTPERFSELMLAAQQEAYMNALDDSGWNPSFWISKLHFYISELPFYNFPYTFGYLLSLGIYALADTFEDQREFADKYRELLIATGCQLTEDAVAGTFGYDLSQAEFWNKSIDIIDRRVDRFLELADQAD